MSDNPRFNFAFVCKKSVEKGKKILSDLSENDFDSLHIKRLVFAEKEDGHLHGHIQLKYRKRTTDCYNILKDIGLVGIKVDPTQYFDPPKRKAMTFCVC